MSIERIEMVAPSDGSPAHCKAVVHGPYVYVSGVQGKGPDVGSQASAVLSEIDRLLALGGSDRYQVIRAEITLRSMSDFSGFNAVWNDWVDAGAPPGRACLSGALSDPDALVEISLVAARQNS